MKMLNQIYFDNRHFLMTSLSLGRVKTYINGCIFSDDNPKIHPLMYIFQYTSMGVFSKYTRCGILKNMLQYTTTGVFSNLKIHPLGYKKTKQLVYHNGCIFRIVMKVLFLRVSATVTSQMRHFPKELLFLRVYATVASQMRHFPSNSQAQVTYTDPKFL